MATYKYYQPNEVVFREGHHDHRSDSWEETGGKYKLDKFLGENSDLPDKNDHDVFFLDTTVCNTGDGENLPDIEATKREAIALFKGDKPISVDYKYILNPPKIYVKDFGLHFESLFSMYQRQEELFDPNSVEDDPHLS